MIRVRTLGQCTILIDTFHVGPDAEIVFASLLLLTVDRGRRVARGELLGMLWPDAPASRASHCLRQAIYRLRTLGVPLEVDRTHLVISPSVVDSDVDAVLRASRTDDTERLADRVSGPFLPGYSPNFSEPLRHWVEQQRDLVSAGARRVLVGAIALRKSRGEWADVERLAHRCLAIDPLNEDATLALAEAAALHGGKVEAMGILDRYLREMGPTARELRLPAMALRRRISEPELEFPLAPPVHVPFVGRSAEMGVLGTALRSARSGVGSANFIHGEPGIGKSRLLTEFTRLAALEGLRLAPVRCQSSDSRRPLSAFVDLVPRLMTLPGALGCSPQSHNYLRRLVEQHPSDAPPTPDTSEAALLYANVRRSLFDLLDAIASEAPLLVTIEDVQWLDPGSWEIVAEAASWVDTRRMMFVLTSREHGPHYPLTVITPPVGLRSLCLGPIDRLAREALFEATLRDSGHPITKAFRDWCVEMSGGNPYYLSELALHGLDAQGGFEVPRSLKALVAQRIARLQPVSCRALQACAILGKNATLDRLELVLDQQRLELLDALDELEERRLIEWDDSQIVCRHDLLAEAAIDRLSALSRRLLHQHAALALEAAIGEDISPSLVWCCAEHWNLAGALERGITLLRKCARQAIELGRPRDAVELLQRAKTLPLAKRGRIDVATELLYAYRAADCWHDATLEFAELRSLRDKWKGEGVVHDDTELIGIEAQWLGGFDIKETVAQLTECCHSVRATPEHRIAAAKLCFIIADNTRDDATARRVFALVERDLNHDQGEDADRLECRLIFETSFGDRGAAKATVESLIEAAHRLPARHHAFSLILAAHACERLGIVQRVHALAKQAYRIGVESSCATAAGAAARKLAWAYLDEGNLEQTQHWYELAMLWVERGQLSSFRADLFGLEAELLIGRHDYLGAEVALQKSRDAWRQTIHSRWKLGVLSAQCAIWLAVGQRGSCESAASEYRELLFPVYREEGNDTFAARYFLLLADIDRYEEAKEELQKYLTARAKSPAHYGAVLKRVIQELSSR
jgi:DNA-binding SARP family transcriptional activator